MGPCPSGFGPLTCLLSASYNTNHGFWLDPELTLPPLGGEIDTVTVSGISAGGAVASAIELSKQVDNAVIVTIICDRGDRYLSTGVFKA